MKTPSVKVSKRMKALQAEMRLVKSGPVWQQLAARFNAYLYCHYSPSLFAHCITYPETRFLKEGE